MAAFASGAVLVYDRTDGLDSDPAPTSEPPSPLPKRTGSLGLSLFSSSSKQDRKAGGEKVDKGAQGAASVRVTIDAGGAILDAQPSPDGKMVAVAGRDGSLK